VQAVPADGMPKSVLISACTSRARYVGPGTLYGALDRLERLGLIESLPADDRARPS